MLLAATMPEMAAALHRQWPADRLERDMQTAANYGIRVIANTITLHAWRNGPIENVHAGRYVRYGLNERRVLPKTEKSIIRHAQDGLFSGLKAADFLRYDTGPRTCLCATASWLTRLTLA